MIRKTIEIKYTSKDYVRVLSFHNYENRRSKFIFGFARVFFILFALLTFVIAISITLEKGFFASITVLLSGIVGLILVFGIKHLERFINKNSLDNQINSSPILQEANLITFDEEGVNWENNLTSSKMKWDGFIKAIESKDDFFLYTTSKVFHFIPKIAFLNLNDLNEFREIVKLNLGDKAEF